MQKNVETVTLDTDSFGVLKINTSSQPPNSKLEADCFKCHLGRIFGPLISIVLSFVTSFISRTIKIFLSNLVNLIVVFQ